MDVSSSIHSRDQSFDVLVIGGGINGVAIARECAQWSKRTLLVEQNDFASGTTSRSTRIIHGGLRYLEHAEIGLVRESLRERERLADTIAASGAPIAIFAGAAKTISFVSAQFALHPDRIVALPSLGWR